MKSDMPQMSSFTSNGKVYGIPFDSSYMVTTVNKAEFAKAGITTMPTTMDQYTKDLEQIKAKGVASTPHSTRTAVTNASSENTAPATRPDSSSSPCATSFA